MRVRVPVFGPRSHPPAIPVGTDGRVNGVVVTKCPPAGAQPMPLSLDQVLVNLRTAVVIADSK